MPLIAMDVDDRRINDRHGPRGGDQTLIDIVQLTRLHPRDRSAGPLGVTSSCWCFPIPGCPTPGWWPRSWGQRLSHAEVKGSSP